MLWSSYQNVGQNYVQDESKLGNVAPDMREDWKITYRQNRQGWVAENGIKLQTYKI
jgi:hypothetical protein